MLKDPVTRIAAVLAWAALGLAQSRTQAAEPAADPPAPAETYVIPQENPYQPGPAIAIHANLPEDEWPQLGNTPQRTNFTPAKFSPAQGQRRWTVCLRDLDEGNLIAPTVQVIIGDGRAYVGCKSGKLYALDAGTGRVQWMFQAGGPIIHTAGYRQGKVYVAAMDGCVYVLDAATGKPVWTFASHRRFGFSTAVLLAEGRLFAIDRGGRLYALATDSGQESWHHDVGAPCDQSPAYDSGMVFFASEDMRVHAVRADDGTEAWTSAQLAGNSFRWFHPVVVGGEVLVQALGYTWTDAEWKKSPESDYLDPMKRSLFALDEATGQERIVLKCTVTGHDGTPPPPAVTRDGHLVLRWRMRFSDGTKVESIYNGWVLEDLATQQILQALTERDLRPPDPWLGNANKPWRAGQFADIENFIPSVAGDTVMAFHRIGIYGWPTCILGGTFDLVERRWHTDARDPGADPKKVHAWMLYGNDGNEDGGSNAAVVANGLLYQQLARYNRIVCYEPMTTGNDTTTKAAP
jgi:hypothetical protein